MLEGSQVLLAENSPGCLLRLAPTTLCSCVTELQVLCPSAVLLSALDFFFGEAS